MDLKRIENIRNEWLDTIDPPEDTRPQCKRCGNHFDPVKSEEDEYCSKSHWHLDQPGQEVQRTIDTWIKNGCSEESILKNMRIYWFYWMTDSTVERWKRVISCKFEVMNEG